MNLCLCFVHYGIQLQVQFTTFAAHFYNNFDAHFVVIKCVSRKAKESLLFLLLRELSEMMGSMRKKRFIVLDCLRLYRAADVVGLTSKEFFAVPDDF